MLLHSATVSDLAKVTARVFDSTARHSGCRLDAYRIDENFFIDIELPGVDPAGIDVSVQDGLLTIRVEREPGNQAERQPGDGDEPAGTVTRQMPVSADLDTDRLDARYDNGVLTLSIPIREKVPAAV